MLIATYFMCRFCRKNMFLLLKFIETLVIVFVNNTLKYLLYIDK